MRCSSKLVVGVLLLSLSGCHCGGGGLNGVSSEGTLDPTTLDFGTLPIGQSVTKTLTIQNIGGAELSLLSATLGGAFPGDYQVVTSLEGTILQAGQRLTVQISFTPQDAGTRGATFTVQTDSRQTPALVATLTGVGVDIKICPQPANIDFGNVQVLGTPATQQLSFNNCGRSPTDVTMGAIEGPQVGDFALTGSLTASLQPGQSLTVTVAYQPQQMGSSTADIPWTACNGCAPSTPIGLTGVGVDGVLTFTPNPATFGTVGPGGAATTIVTATNTGTEPLTVQQVNPQVGNPFSLPTPPSLPITLQPGQTFTFPVKFSPSTGGVANDMLLGNYAVADPAVAVRQANDPLQGNGIQLPCTITASPNPLNFGNVSPNTTAKRKLTLTNKGNLACNVSGIALGAGTDPYFHLATPGTTSLVVPPGGTATVGVNFAPTSNSAPLVRTGTLIFQSDDPAHPNNSVPLSGNVNNTIYTGGWPKWHLDNFNSGQTLADTSQLTGTVAWKFNVGGPCCSGNRDRSFMHSPVIDQNGNIYFENAGAGQNSALTTATLYAVNSSGTQIWTQQVSDDSQDGHPSTPVLLANGDLYAISGEERQPTQTTPNLYLMSMTSGAILFSMPYGPTQHEGFSATPAFGNDGTLFEVDDDGFPNNGGDPYDAICFKQTGNTITQTAAYLIPFNITYSNRERASIVIAQDDTSYWCAGNNCFGMSPPASGFTPLPAWPAAGVTFVTPDAAADPRTVTPDVAMDSSPGGYFFAYAGWQTTVSGNTAVGGALVAMAPANGAIQWTVTLPATALPTGSTQTLADYGNASPAVATDSTVYVGNGDGLRAVDGRAGTVKWLFKSADVTTAPAIGADGTVFFGTKDGTFYAVNPDGSLRFSIKAGAQIGSAPAIANDGTVYFVADDGFLYAIQ